MANIEALNQLVRVLSNVKEDEFDLSSWYSPEITPPVWKFWAPSCGTTACAIGWAAIDPWFNKAGLRLNRLADPMFEDETSFDAVARFFDISVEQANWLFDPKSYKTRGDTESSQVLSRVRKLIADPKYGHDEYLAKF